MAYEMVMPYHLHMPSYFLETFTEYPYKFNTFIAMFLIISEIYLFLFRTHVILIIPNQQI